MTYRYHEIIEELSKKGSVPGLETMCHLLDYLDHPEKDLRIVHAAGTNGKGSTLAFLAEILIQSGYSVGRYISPTIRCYAERFQIDHHFISEERMEIYYKRIREISEQMREKGLETPTIFEAETAIALLYFREEHVDYALIETGMGGLMDATNAIRNPFLTMITSISEDHKGFLGDSIEEIAAQKAGIIKSCAPVILAENPESVRQVILRQCKEKETTCSVNTEKDFIIIEETPYGNRFEWQGDSYQIMLPGAHQISNAMTALSAAEALSQMAGGEKISRVSMKSGLYHMRWPGRLELLSTDPYIYLDGAHNPDGAAKLAEFLQKHFTNKRIIYIMGVLGDKEYGRMLAELMPLAAAAYVFRPANARGLDAACLAEAMAPYGIPVTVCPDVYAAYRQALEHEEADCFVVCGSLSFIEELMQKLHRNKESDIDEDR